MVWRRLQAEGLRGVLAITLLALISLWSHYPLVGPLFGASTVLLFGHPSSTLAQPRNMVLGNTLGALVSVIAVATLGHAPWVVGLAVGLTIALGQSWRCLHPPAGAVALLGGSSAICRRLMRPIRTTGSEWSVADGLDQGVVGFEIGGHAAHIVEVLQGLQHAQAAAQLLRLAEGATGLRDPAVFPAHYG